MGERGPALVLGGGVAGLSAGYYLARAGYPVTLVERAAVLGGLCASFESNGFTLDHGAHKLYSTLPGILDEIRRILGPGLIEHRKVNRIRLLGRFLDYPLTLGNLLPALGPRRALGLGLGYAGAMASGLLRRGEPASYEDYILSRFGRGVYELVFEPLASKVWGDPAALSADLARARIPTGGATELILRLLRLKASTQDVDAPFFYYPRGGFGRWPDALATGMRAAGGRILCSATPVSVEWSGARVSAVTVEKGGGVERLACDTLVSSIPISALAGLLYPNDAEVQAATRGLPLRDLALVYLFLRQDRLVPDHWIFVPERKFLFSRLFEQKSMSAELGPGDRTAVCCDFTFGPGDEISRSPDRELVRRCLDGLVEMGLTGADRLEASLVKRVRGFYPVYTVDYRERLRGAYDRLRSASNLLLTGRLGMFNYNNSDHCLDMGFFLARELEAGRTPGEVWEGLEERVRGYRIVD